MVEEARTVVLTFRVSPREQRELILLARAERKSRSELLRGLLQAAADDLIKQTPSGPRFPGRLARDLKRMQRRAWAVR